MNETEQRDADLKLCEKAGFSFYYGRKHAAPDIYSVDVFHRLIAAVRAPLLEEIEGALTTIEGLEGTVQTLKAEAIKDAGGNFPAPRGRELGMHRI